MSTDDLLRRLAEDEHPSDSSKNRMRMHILRDIRRCDLQKLAEKEVPSDSVRERILQRITSRSQDMLPAIRDGVSFDNTRVAALKERVMARLQPVRQPMFDRVLKWGAAFAAFTLLVRMAPLVFLAPTIQAGSSVVVMPGHGDATVTIAGISLPLEEAQELRGTALIETGDGEATIIIHDDGVFRLAPHSSIRVLDLTDRPEPTSGPTVAYISGQVWALGLLPPNVSPIIIALPGREQIMLREGSLSIDDSYGIVASVFDKRATISRDGTEQFVVAGESTTIASNIPLHAKEFRESEFQMPWAAQNLNRDAVHRKEIAQLQQQRREDVAGILPTSPLYSAKRFAEEIDVLFTVGDDARAQKRIQQAETRLNEAIALIEDGRSDKASGPIGEYRETLLSMASGTGDNLVKFLLRQQSEQAAASLSTLTPEDETYVLKEAVYDVVAAVPNANLSAQDIQGYVLVDKLASIHRSLINSGSVLQAKTTYEEVQPYLQALLDDDSVMHPLLKKEASSLLALTSRSLAAADIAEEDKDVVAALSEEIAQYLPADPVTELISEQEVDRIVQEMVDRIFVYSMSRGRYNQLVLEMKSIENNPDRGRILRRLYIALPENGLARYVRDEMVQLRDELENAR